MMIIAVAHHHPEVDTDLARQFTTFHTHLMIDESIQWRDPADQYLKDLEVTHRQFHFDIQIHQIAGIITI